MADKTERFVSIATIYRSGSGHPFAPGEPVDLHPDHAGDLRAAGLEAVRPKPELDTVPKSSAKKP